LGLRLYKRELTEEHAAFLHWLEQLISEREIDVLLISGDVFDIANPPRDALSLYYGFLARMHAVGCRVIVTGGNHDSPGLLNAPREVLGIIGADVVGSVPEHPEDQVIPLQDAGGRLAAVVCAVPYVREPDIHRLTKGEEFTDKVHQLGAAIRNLYRQLAEYCQARFQVPLIAMGHLFAAGAETSDSEREIQIGNLAQVAAGDFPQAFDYVALGHIHRPQRVGGEERIRYSGSPIPLSFSEKKDHKIVIELDIRDGRVTQVDHPVPFRRKLLKFTGSLEDIQRELDAYVSGDHKAWAEAEVRVAQATPALQQQVNAYFRDLEHPGVEVLNYRIQNTDVETGITGWAEGSVQLEDLGPKGVMNGMLENLEMSDEDREAVMRAFTELMEIQDESETP
jgi:DNA repair protein SbcD/Mre11